MRGFVGTELFQSCTACVRHSSSGYHYPATLYAIRLSENGVFMNLAFVEVPLEHFLVPGPSSSLTPIIGRILLPAMLDLP